MITDENFSYLKQYRIQERFQFVSAFKKVGLEMQELKEQEISGEVLPKWFIPNAYTFLAKTPSLVLLVRLEDILEQEEQTNLPGTFMEYPNWRYKLTECIEYFENNSKLTYVCTLLEKERHFE